MWSGVDEVRHADKSCRDADDGAIEGSDEDLAMRVEGLCDVEIVRSEGLEPGLVLVLLGTFVLACGGDVGASGIR